MFFEDYGVNPFVDTYEDHNAIGIRISRHENPQRKIPRGYTVRSAHFDVL